MSGMFSEMLTPDETGVESDAANCLMNSLSGPRRIPTTAHEMHPSSSVFLIAIDEYKTGGGPFEIGLTNALAVGRKSSSMSVDFGMLDRRKVQIDLIVGADVEQSVARIKLNL